MDMRIDEDELDDLLPYGCKWYVVAPRVHAPLRDEDDLCTLDLTYRPRATNQLAAWLNELGLEGLGEVTCRVYLSPAAYDALSTHALWSPIWAHPLVSSSPTLPDKPYCDGQEQVESLEGGNDDVR